MVRCGQSRRAGAHHRHLLSSAHLGNMWDDEPSGIALLHDGQLVLLHRDWVTVQATGTGRLAQGGAHPAGKLRKVVGLSQPFQGVVQVAVVYQVVPLRNQIVQRTAGIHPRQLHPGLAEGHAALHAPGPLPLPLLFWLHGMELIPVPDALQRRLRRIAPARIVQKSCGFSHYRSPPVIA